MKRKQKPLGLRAALQHVAEWNSPGWRSRKAEYESAS